MNYILLDLSYLIFYRYCALLTWWKLARPDDELGIPIENKEFVEKFRKIFIEKIKEIPKKLKIDPKSVCFIGGQDCYRGSIWRHEFCKDYKANRLRDDSFMGGPFFKMVYDNNFIKETGCKFILYHEYLEADDCIAITSFYLLKKFPESHQYIITNDHDYLQLAKPNVSLFNLKYNELTKNKNCTGDPQKDLFCKIVLGDKSDNIPGIFKKCGTKIAQRCYDEPEFLEKMFIQQPEAREKFDANKKIIDFHKIPEDLIVEFIAGIGF
jgi:5'-3' exonuclease